MTIAPINGHIRKRGVRQTCRPRQEKWSLAQAREIFEQVSVTAPFWALELDAGGKSF
jgi:hypothetical protein